MKWVKVSAVYFFLCSMFLCITCVHAQEVKKTMPPFKIQLTNNSYYRLQDLKKDKPSMLVYFSPTCEHCKEFTKEMLAHNDAFKKLQIIMVTYLSTEDIKKFEEEFHLKDYPNIKAGTEGNTFLTPKYYDIRTFPFVALFNKAGKLVTTYRSQPDVKKVMQSVKNL